MRAFQLLPAYSGENRARVLTIGAVLMIGIAVADWKIQPNVSLGILYIFPILLVAGFLSRSEILALATMCAILREAYSPFAWQPNSLARMAAVEAAFLGAGLFVSEMVRNRQLVVQYLQRLEEQVMLRQEAEEQLRVLIETSPAAILTVDAEGKILLANRAAHRTLAVEDGSLKQQPIGDYLPVLAAVPRNSGKPESFRTAMECKGQRQNGEVFLANVWFSTYETRSGPRLAAIVLDTSEDLREREESGLHSVMTTSRVLVGAVLHEVRNLSAAATIAHANLASLPELARSDDFRALGSLVKGLEKVASSELRLASDALSVSADLYTVLDELRIVIEPQFRECEMTIEWRLPEGLPLVHADHQGLLQVFLNLAHNSHRSMRDTCEKRLTIAASVQSDQAWVRFQDTGAGIPRADRLFQPFQPGADATGLGLYVSRAMIRSFGGDLRCEPQPLGSCFAIRLSTAGIAAGPPLEHGKNSDSRP